MTQGNVDPPANSPPRSRQINKAPTLGQGKMGGDDSRVWPVAKLIANSAEIMHIYLPFFINWLGIVALIFGGCCSNVCYNPQHLGRLRLT